MPMAKLKKKNRVLLLSIIMAEKVQWGRKAIKIKKKKRVVSHQTIVQRKCETK